MFNVPDGEWWHFNDSSVRQTEIETVAKCKPYIMFYIRREFQLPPLHAWLAETQRVSSGVSKSVSADWKAHSTDSIVSFLLKLLGQGFLSVQMWSVSESPSRHSRDGTAKALPKVILWSNTVLKFSRAPSMYFNACVRVENKQYAWGNYCLVRCTVDVRTQRR